jgi:rare lipoprotein A (peptidoglycan hydrolase)
MGVAHRTLPCGTRVAIHYRGRSVTVPVVDRGPYTSATWDLTEATAQALGFDGRDWIRVSSPIVTRSLAHTARHHRRHHHYRRR